MSRRTQPNLLDRIKSNPLLLPLLNLPPSEQEPILSVQPVDQTLRRSNLSLGRPEGSRGPPAPSLGETQLPGGLGYPLGETRPRERRAPGGQGRGPGTHILVPTVEKRRCQLEVSCAVHLYGYAVQLYGYAVQLYGYALQLYGYAVQLYNFAVQL